MKNIWFKPPKDLQQIFEDLKEWPNKKVDGKTAQRLSRFKKIRQLSRKDKIRIKDKHIMIPRRINIKKTKKGYKFESKF